MNPKAENIQNNLVQVLVTSGQHAKAHNLRGMILSDQGRDIEAIDSYQTSLSLEPNKPDTLSNLSLPLSRSNRGQEALTMLERALAINPAHLNAQQRYAIQLNEAGRAGAAKQALDALLEISPNHAETLYQLSQMQTAKENASMLPAVKSALSKAAKNAPDRGHLNFALANIHWQASDYESAARALKYANDQVAGMRPFDINQQTQQKDTILGLFAPDVLPPVASNAGPTPIFVIGQPRSGTTLVEQILSAHPDVTGFGELATAGRLAAQVLDGGQGFKPEKFAADYLADLPQIPDGARAFIDKMPVNYCYVGFLASAFPNARFICLGRDPRDVALSMWRSYFPSRGMDFTFDFAAMAHVANLHKEYMAHWAQVFPDRILDIRYEDIVGDVDAASRKLAQF
ncbi:MAG: sulfotransferase, partial [Marinosulfonomonas sp.]|nr:sulfotransferase [Marinosulfonomonas sp.]